MLGLDRRYFSYLWSYTPHLAVALVVMLGVAALEIATPWPLKYIVDNVVGGRPLTDPLGSSVLGLVGSDPRWLAAFFGMLIIVFAVLGGIFSFTYEYLLSAIRERVTFRLRADAFAHLQRLSLQFHDRSRTGEIINRVTVDADRTMEAVVTYTTALLINSLKFAGIAGVMLFVNWRFSIIALAYAPLIFFTFGAFRRNIRASARMARAEDGQMLTVTHETVSAIRIVKAFGREADEQRRFEQYGEARVQAGLRAARWEASFEPVIDMIKAAGVAAVIWYGVAEILAGHLTVGELLIFLSYLGTFYSPVKRFGKLAGMLQRAVASGERLAELLNSDQVTPDAPRATSLARPAQRVDFEDVSFSYNGTQPALRGVSFTALPGQTVALVGSTGAGKTTVANLLLRFYDPDGGRILLDGVDARQIRLSDLRRQFALVPQDPMLFAVSVRDNIAYGRPEASMPEIIAAAWAANAHAFITALPDGYKTVVGERGATLSGGQRQRIAIARAILRGAPILILDEPTAALDASSERDVMDALDKLMNGRTTFIIAHRLSTIRNADLVLVFEAGQIIERGRHEELLARGGRYAEMIRLQQARTGQATTPGDRWVGN